MNARFIKRLLRPLERTPLHPQWLMSGSSRELDAWLGDLRGRVLDVGSATQWARERLAAGTEYLAMDYPTTAQAYGCRPAVYGDAQRLPFGDGSLDAVLLLDVLEHVADPERALREIARVLKRDGQLVLRVPFLYPVHDAPHDHSRWTAYGHRALAQRAGFAVAEELRSGAPAVTAGLLANLAMGQGLLAAWRQRSPAIVLGVLAPLLVPSINIAAWLLGKLLPRDDSMPYSVSGRWRKT